MADELVNRALEEIAGPLTFYLTELGYIVQAPTPGIRATYERTAQRKLSGLTEALQLARQRYEVVLGESEVINYGIRRLCDLFLVNASFAQRTGNLIDIQLAEHLRKTLEAILMDASSSPTLAGLLVLSGDHQQGFGSR